MATAKEVVEIRREDQIGASRAKAPGAAEPPLVDPSTHGAGGAVELLSDGGGGKVGDDRVGDLFSEAHLTPPTTKFELGDLALHEPLMPSRTSPP